MRCAWPLLFVGCTRIPEGRFAVDRVDVRGGSGELAEGAQSEIATTATPKFLGLFRGVVYDYELFDGGALAYDLARVERYYRARGYWDARVRAGRVARDGDLVRVEIEVTEGEPVVVESVRFTFDGPLEDDARARAGRAARHTAPGAPLDEDEIAALENEVVRALEDHGYAKVSAHARARVDLARHRATVLVEVIPRERCVLGAVKLENLGSLPERAVRAQLDLHEGEPFTRAALDRAQQRLIDLGVVTSMRITPVTDGAPHGVVPILVHLEPARSRDLRLGGGFELDPLKTDVHLRARWQDRNFLGGLRRFDADVLPGLVLYPTRLSKLQAPTDLLFSVRSRVELRQPSFLEPLTSGLVRLEPNLFPVLVRTQYVPGEPILGYRELKTNAGLERRFGVIDLTFAHVAQVDDPFAYKGPLDPTLTTLFISYLEVLATIDLRDNPVHPRSGAFLSANVQAAGLGGQPRDVRLQPEARGYVSLTKDVVVAGRATVGLLFPFNYQVGSDTRDVQIVFFRGFFSGGPTQNRGYPLRGIGPQGQVGFFNPIVNQCPTDVSCSVPLGGLTLWEASLEGRFRLGGPLWGVLFCDASDVQAQPLTFRFDRPHLSCGAGARYDTPVGPLRVDVGWRVPGAQASGGVEYAPDIAGLPIAIQIGLGEAY